MVVIWARNLETKQINAFIVRKGNPGFKTGKIEKKIALRCVQNADIEMVGCVVPDSARLPGVNSFQVGRDGIERHKIGVGDIGCQPSWTQVSPLGGCSVALSHKKKACLLQSARLLPSAAPYWRQFHQRTCTLFAAWLSS